MTTLLRRGMMQQASNSGAQIESGQFTISEKTKTYDITHNLGVVPNFVFIYPLDVTDANTAYMVASQLIVKDCGQADWKVGTESATRLGNHGVFVGSGYAVSVAGANRQDNLPKSNTVGNVTTIYSGEFTNGYVRVGGYDGTTGSGWLLGTYGYIVGVMPFIQPTT